jgi:hypothetical protein
MELREFVKKALVEIAEAVVDAQAEADHVGARVNPAMFESPHARRPSIEAQGWPIHEITTVEFDIAVMATEESSSRAGIAVLGGVFGLGAQMKSGEGSSSASRIKFRVPIYIPTHQEGVAAARKT